mmetsp:Transcript_43904/g.80231  ORF Transcript_43904/g.80231 Transcript_43904/m.80231 type:complete len:213 (-) Transcript_43904:150-788(-)
MLARVFAVVASAGWLILPSVATSCPDYVSIANLSNPSVEGFAVEKYVGTWYEIYSHNLPVLTSGCHCTKYDVDVNGTDGWGTRFTCHKGSASASPTHLFSRNKMATDPKLPGKLTEAWQLPLGTTTPATDYWVLDVGLAADDSYDNVLVYSCTHELLWKQEWIYLFSRRQSLQQDKVKSWMQYMKQHGIDTSSITEVPQETACATDLSVMTI